MNIPLNINFQQILLHMFNFLILATGLYLLIYHPVKQFMDKRLNDYAEKDKQTNDALEHAKQLETEYTEKLENVKEEISERKRAASLEIEQTKQEEIQNARLKSERIIANARKEGDAQKNKIVRSAQTEIENLAAAAASKILLGTSSELYDEFINQAEGSLEDEQ